MTYQALQLPVSQLKILTRSGHYINVGEIFIEKVAFDKNGREIRTYTINERVFENACQRLQAYQKQQAVTPTWEREEP